MDQLAEVVKEIEEEQALGKLSTAYFKRLTNQPELLSISSANAQAIGPTYGYSQFTANLPSGRPILEAQTLQLLTANIPLCTPCIADTACVFWYYRLDVYSGFTPNTDNLFFVRLLPSYYKPEFFNHTTIYGQNVTFNNYNDLASQLALSCAADVALDNMMASESEWAGLQDFQMQFNPYDISLTYNSTQNRFQMTGLNTEAPLVAYSAADTYAAGTTYAADVFVSYDGAVYRSLKDGNVGNTPSRTNNQWWAYVTNRLVRDFAAYTPYYAGQYMAYGGTIYQAAVNAWSGSPNIGTDWVAPTYPIGDYNYRYLIAGYNDPNVVSNQGTNIRGQNGRQWNQYALYEAGDIVQYNGVNYQANKQNKGFLPFYIPTIAANTYDQFKQYLNGDYVYYNSRWYVNIWVRSNSSQPNYTQGLPSAPTGAYTNNTWWKFIEFSPDTTTVYWKAGDLMTNVTTAGFGVFWWKCIKDNNVYQTSPVVNGGVFNTNPYWIPSYWTPVSSAANLPTTGLYAISQQFDFLDSFNGYLQFPFPIAIPPQPFNPAPRRLLNSILGFCWNGVFNPVAVNTTLGTLTGIPNGTTTSDVLNRIRPVPFYAQYGSSGSTLQNGYATIATTYTADGYCNLVYTSVVHIYANIVYGSTVTSDPQRSTSLIGLASMNAGNLGVSFFANFINGPLTVNESDIYSIVIELRDEMNEPYPVTNNGICTFTLKLTYKDSPQEK